MGRRRPFPGQDQRFRQARKYLGYSQTEMAAMLDTSQSVISAIERAVTDIPKHAILRLRQLGIDPIWVMSGIGVMVLQNSPASTPTAGYTGVVAVKDAPPISPFRAVPILGYVPAGYPGPSPVIEHLDGYFPLPTKDVPDPDTFMLRVQSDSMKGFVEKGDLVAVSPMLRSALKPDDMVVVRIEPDDTMVKRYVRTDDGVVFLSSNPKYKPIIVAGNDSRTVEVIGKVIYIIHRQS